MDSEYVEIIMKRSEMNEIIEIIEETISSKDNFEEIERLLFLRKIIMDYSKEPRNDVEFLTEFMKFCRYPLEENKELSTIEISAIEQFLYERGVTK